MSISYRNVPPSRFSLKKDPISDDALLLFWKSGEDTYDLAVRFGIPEGKIESRLWRVREKRRGKPA